MRCLSGPNDPRIVLFTTRTHLRLLFIFGGTVALGVCLLIAMNGIQMRWLADKQWHDLHVQGVLRAGIDPGWQPYSFYDAQGWAGMDADITRELARRMGEGLQVIPVGYDSMYDALHIWQVDMVISAVTVDSSRTADYAYTEPYFNAGLKLVTPITSEIVTADNLAGKRVAVMLGSTADITARYWQRRLVDMQRIGVEDDQHGLALLRTGDVDALLLEALNVSALRVGTDQLKVIDIESQPHVIAVRRDNPWLLAELNQQLQSMHNDGSIQVIVDRWMR